MKIILGSQSKNRKKVLTQMGYEFETMAADIDEKAIRDPDPKKLVLMLANAKANALLPKIKKPTLLITSDQVVLWNGQIREKPESPTQAREYLRTLSQYPSETITSVVVSNTATGKSVEGVDTAKVYFKSIPDDVIAKLIEKGEVFEKAGGYTVDESLLEPYIDRIEGEFESVLGLPKKMIKSLLEQVK